MIKCLLKVELAKNDLTQKQLAELTEVRLPTINDMITGKSKAISIDNLKGGFTGGFLEGRDKSIPMRECVAFKKERGIRKKIILGLVAVKKHQILRLYRLGCLRKAVAERKRGDIISVWIVIGYMKQCSRDIGFVGNRDKALG